MRGAVALYTNRGNCVATASDRDFHVAGESIAKEVELHACMCVHTCRSK